MKRDKGKIKAATAEPRQESLSPPVHRVLNLEGAPLIFANGLLKSGLIGPNAYLLLCTRRDLEGPDGNIPHFYVTADLRIPVPALAIFRDTIDKLMLLAAKPAGEVPS